MDRSAFEASLLYMASQPGLLHGKSLFWKETARELRKPHSLWDPADTAQDVQDGHRHLKTAREQCLASISGTP